MFICEISTILRAYIVCMLMFCKYINCLCSTRFLLTVNILCSSILEVIKIYIPFGVSVGLLNGMHNTHADLYRLNYSNKLKHHELTKHTNKNEQINKTILQKWTKNTRQYTNRRGAVGFTSDS